MDIYEKMNKVNDKESFVDFLKSLSKDFNEDKDHWENITGDQYLESISAYLKDSEDKNLDYKELANIFYVGKIYE